MSKPKYVCGKCGSGGLYRDDDPQAARVYIACWKCGNRFPGGPKPVEAGNHVGCVSTHRKEGDEMKKECVNCHRVKSIVKQDLCFTCLKPAKGKTGEERASALAEVKARIDSGGLRHTGGGRRPANRATQERKKASNAPRSHRIKADVDQQRSTQAPPAPPADLPAVHRPAIDELTDFSGQRTVIQVTREGVDCIVLPLTADDRALRDRILELAKRYRRDPAQQVLWMVQNEIANGK